MNTDEQMTKLILTKYFKKLSENPNPNIGLTVGLEDENDIYNWTCSLIGPNDSPYKGGYFKLSIQFPKNYPKEGPEVVFDTPIYHLNVNPVSSEKPLGHVCISTINFWEPDRPIEDILVSIFALFNAANPDSAFGLDYQIEFNKNRDLYDKKAKYFTKKYANDEPPKNLKKWDFTLGEDFYTDKNL